MISKIFRELFSCNKIKNFHDVSALNNFSRCLFLVAAAKLMNKLFSKHEGLGELYVVCCMLQSQLKGFTTICMATQYTSPFKSTCFEQRFDMFNSPSELIINYL